MCPFIVFLFSKEKFRDAQLHAARGSGRFIARSTPEPVVRQRLTGNPDSIVRRYFQTEPSTGEQE